MDKLLLPFIGLAAITAGIVLANRRRIGIPDPYTDKQLLRKGLDKPIIWLFYNDSQVNSRVWQDFGARSSRAINIPFLNLCYETILKHNSNEYRIEVIGGLSGIAERLGGYESLPAPLRSTNAIINQAELDWIRSAILTKYGGLWLSPSVICTSGFSQSLKTQDGTPLQKNVFFGTDLGENKSGPDGTDVPGFRAIWAGRSGHNVFAKLEEVCRKRLDERGGGVQFRNDAKSDFIDFVEKDIDTIIMPQQELARKGKDGKCIELDDLLGAGNQGIPSLQQFLVSSKTIYIPISLEELEKRRSLEWFLRMSESQIFESDLVVSNLFKDALGK